MKQELKEFQKKDLLKLLAFPEKQYKTFSLTSLTTYSVFWLDAWGITTSLENVSVANYKLFPAKFCLVGWPEFPDTNRVNRTVLQMRPQYRNLASSSSERGIFLNENGIKEAEALVKSFGNPQIDGGSTFNQPRIIKAEGKSAQGARSVHSEDIIGELKKSKLFLMYLEEKLEEAEAIHLIAMLKLYDHTPGKEKRKILKKIKEAARDSGDDQVTKFITSVEDKFKNYLQKN